MADETAGPNGACFEIGRPIRDVHVDTSRELEARTMSLRARWRLENNLPKVEAEWETLWVRTSRKK